MGLQTYKHHARRVSNSDNERRAHRISSARESRKAPVSESRSGRYMKKQNSCSSATSVIALVSRDVSSSAQNLELPGCLERPNYQEVPKTAIIAVDPDSDIGEIPLDYIVEKLEVQGPQMLQVIDSVQATFDDDTLPTRVSLVVNDMCSDMPTHVLAVSSPGLPGSPRHALIHPIHHIILATHCASLPQLLRTTPRIPDETGHITLPVLLLNIPSVDTFSLLIRFLYTKDSLQLLGMLLPTRSATPVWLLDFAMDFDPDAPKLSDYRVMLGQTFTLQVLMKHIWVLNGLWKNASALGVSDPGLWDVLDLAWHLVLGAVCLEYPAEPSSSQP